jgi:peptide-methionine (S)-S-oxide reductase
MLFARKKLEIPTAEAALKGRTEPIPTAKTHHINKHALKGPYPEGTETAIFGLGCFWGAERVFWQMGDGIWVTAAGYAGGHTPNPTYEEVCSGRTGHNEVVLVVFDPKKVSYEALLKTFWESRPTRHARATTSARSSSGSVTSQAQRRAAEASGTPIRRCWHNRYGPISTEIVDAPPFYFAEDYHQQYLAKVPHGYCGPAGGGAQLPGRKGEGRR